MTTSVQPLVSVVTPVYNEERHLAECIESVLSQTYSNWDYTIIDNCSTDGTFEIAQRYAAKDRRIRVHRNERTAAVIPNHNIALRQISPESKYCKVVFGDDWIFPNCLEQMVGLAEAHPSVGIVGAYALEGQRVAGAGLSYSDRVIGGREICRLHMIDELHVFGSANAVLYRADLVRSQDCFYDEANIHADTDACFRVLAASDFGFVHQILTFTRVRPVSLSAATADIETWFAGRLQLLTAHAPKCLTQTERNERIARHMEKYYQFFGKSLILRRDKPFWKYHKNELAKAGLKFSRLRVVKGLLDIVFAAAANPKESLERLLKRRRKLSLADRVDNQGGKSSDTAEEKTKSSKLTQGTSDSLTSA